MLCCCVQAHGLQVMCDVQNLANLPDGSWMGHWPSRSPKDVCNLDFWRQNATAPADVLAVQRYSTVTYAAEAVRLIEANVRHETPTSAGASVNCGLTTSPTNQTDARIGIAGGRHTDVRLPRVAGCPWAMEQPA